LALAKEAAQNHNFEEAIKLLRNATVYPENLGEGKLYGAQENDINYWLGCMYEKLSDVDLANKYWSLASVGLEEPTAAIFYNDQQPDKIFYQGLAHLKLGNIDAANLRFNNLINYGLNNLNKEVKIDFFAVSLPDLSIFEDDLNIRNNIHCHYLIGLGYLGLNDLEKAKKHFKTVLELDPVHLGSIIHQSMC
jgi:tetratricopeptide (TPR) repeat protein